MSLLICLTITMGLDKILWHNILMFSRFSAILKKEEMLTRLEYTFFPFNVEAQIGQSVNHKLGIPDAVIRGINQDEDIINLNINGKPVHTEENSHSLAKSFKVKGACLMPKHKTTN